MLEKQKRKGKGKVNNANLSFVGILIGISQMTKKGRS